MKDRFWASLLVFIDYIFAAIAWGVFFYLRKTQIEGQDFNADLKFYLGLTLVPLFWVFFYFIQGTYQDIRRIFRLQMVNLTLVASFLGTIILFFTLLIDDDVKSYQYFYRSIFFLSKIMNIYALKLNIDFLVFSFWEIESI